MQGWRKMGGKKTVITSEITVWDLWIFFIRDFSLLSSLGYLCYHIKLYMAKSSLLFYFSCSCFASILVCHCQTSKLPVRQKKTNNNNECIVSIQTKSKEHFVKDCSNQSSIYESFSLSAVDLISCCKHSKKLADFQWKHKKEGKTNLTHCFFYPLVSKPTNHQLCLSKDFGNLPWQSKSSTVAWGLKKWFKTDF